MYAIPERNAILENWREILKREKKNTFFLDDEEEQIFFDDEEEQMFLVSGFCSKVGIQLI